MPGSMPGEKPRPGIAAVVLPDGMTRDVADDLCFPNGMAVTPDGTMPVVAESHAAQLTAFTIAADGSLTDRRTWADLGEGAAPDGICLDADGRCRPGHGGGHDRRRARGTAPERPRRHQGTAMRQ